MSKRKVPAACLGLLAGFQSRGIWAQNKTIGMAKGKASAVAFTITLLGGRVRLWRGMGAIYMVEIDLRRKE